MKQIISLLLALIMLLCCAGCSPAPIPPEPDPEPASEPAPVTQEVQETQEPQELQEVPKPKEGQFVFTRENFPRLDGSTSTVPLAQAMAAILLSEPQEQVEDLIAFSRTTNAYRALIYRYDPRAQNYQLDSSAPPPDLLLAAEPAESVWELEAAKGIEWDMEPFAIDGLIFVVNEDNPVDSLTIEQVQKIYTGEIINWSEVGGDDVEIIPFQRNEDAGSQTMMKKLVMGELPMMEPPLEYRADSMGTLMESVREYEDSTGAIGYSVYYYANDMRMAEGLKILQIDGVEPGADSFRDKSYPFTNPYYVVKRPDHAEDDPTTILFHWILSEEGQRLVDQLGYVAVQPPGEDAEADNKVPSVYVNWSMLEDTYAVPGSYPLYWPEPKTELIPHNNYGILTPFYGKDVPIQYQNLFYHNGRFLFGLSTLDGKVVVEPVYSEASSLYWNDKALPVYVLQRTIADEERIAAEKQSHADLGEEVLEYLYGLAAVDGSWHVPLEYAYATAISPDRILLVDIEGKFWLCDLDGNIEESPITETAEELWEPNWRELFNYENFGFFDNYLVMTLFFRYAEDQHAMWVDFQTGEKSLKPGSHHDFYDSEAATDIIAISNTGLEIRSTFDEYYCEGVYDPTAETWVIEPQPDSYPSFFNDVITGETYIRSVGIYNTSGELLFHADRVLPPVNGIFPVYDGNWSGLIDKEGNWVMRFIIPSNTD